MSRSRTVSFRDPAGFVYCEQGDPRRQVNRVYSEHYDKLMASGLYQELVDAGLLVKHAGNRCRRSGAVAGLQGDPAREDRSSSYPYEWSFSQLKDAASCAEVQAAGRFCAG